MLLRLLGPSQLASMAFLVMVAGMVATPLFGSSSDERQWLAIVVVGALFICGLASSIYSHGRRAIFAAAGIVSFTFLVEVVGSTTGFPFGSYDYTDRLVPQLFGVPVVVSFAWAGITLVVHAVLRDVRRGSAVRDRIVQVAMMSSAITAWDAFLDPQMVAEGYWVWEPASLSYRGIPLVNYLGWFFTAGITSSIALFVCAVSQRTTHLPRIVYTTLAVLSTIGFLVFFDDVIVAMVGGVAMGIFVVVSFRVTAKHPT